MQNCFLQDVKWFSVSSVDLGSTGEKLVLKAELRSCALPHHYLVIKILLPHVSGVALATASTASGKASGRCRFWQSTGIAKAIVFNRPVLFVRALALWLGKYCLPFIFQSHVYELSPYTQCHLALRMKGSNYRQKLHS